MVDDYWDYINEGEENEENVPTSEESNCTHAKILLSMPLSSFSSRGGIMVK